MELSDFLQEPLKMITDRNLVSLTLKSDCLNGVGLLVILDMSMWLTTACRQTGFEVHCRVADPNEYLSYDGGRFG